MGFFLFVMKCGLRFIYLLFMPLKAQNKVVMLSRESDTPPLDFRLLEKEIAAFSNQMKKN